MPPTLSGLAASLPSSIPPIRRLESVAPRPGLGVLELLLAFGLLLMPVARLLQITITESATKSAPLSVLDVIVIALAGVYCARSLAHRQVPFFHRRLPSPITLFLAWALVSLLVSAAAFDLDRARLTFSVLYLARWASYAAFYFAAALIGRRMVHVPFLLKCLLAGQVLFAGFGIVQAIYLPNFAFILHPRAIASVDYDLQGHRLVSTFLDPNIAAAYIATGVLLGLALYLAGLKRMKYVVLLELAALFATLSRGGLLGCAAGAIFLLWNPRFSRSRAIFIAIVGLLVLAAILPWLVPEILRRGRLTLSDASAQSRVSDWLLALRIFAARPIFGIGFNTFGFVAEKFATGALAQGNSSFGLAGDLLLIPALTGLPGAILYAAIIWQVRKACAALRNQGSEWVHGLAQGTLAVTLAALLSALFCNVITFPEIAGTLFCLWGLVSGIAESQAMQRGWDIAHSTVAAAA